MPSHLSANHDPIYLQHTPSLHLTFYDFMKISHFVKDCFSLSFFCLKMNLIFWQISFPLLKYIEHNIQSITILDIVQYIHL